MKYSVNSLITSMVRNCSTEENSSQWISKKQIKFLCDVAAQEKNADIQEEFIRDKRGGHKVHIDTNEFRISITISSINGAGTANVYNKKVGIENFNIQAKNEYEQLVKEHEELVKADEIEMKNHPEKYQGVRHIILRSIEDLENRINSYKTKYNF